MIVVIIMIEYSTQFHISQLSVLFWGNNPTRFNSKRQV